MDDIVWVGIRESEVIHSNFINESIALFGNKKNCLENKVQKAINHNDFRNYSLIDDFYNEEVINKIKENKDVKFMYYSQIYSYDSMEKLGLLDHVVCLNDNKLVKFLNNKFETRNYLKSYIPMLNYYFICGNDCNFKDLKRKYEQEEFVIQSEEGAGGFGTTLLNKQNANNITFDNEKTYMVTKYCKNNIPINISILISKDAITLLPPSIQIIEILNNKLIYKGSDFIAYNEIVDSKTDSKVKDYANIIGKLMMKKGYRGILGIDSIIYDNEIYFMEINPRFQGSSAIINKALLENNLPSLQELNYNCFYDKPINLKPFNVNYSSYVYEYYEEARQIDINPVEILDKCSDIANFEDFSYLYTCIYDKKITEGKKYE